MPVLFVDSMLHSLKLNMEISMNFVKIIIAVTLLGFLSACEISGPKIKLPGVVIKTTGDGHCPPGQAKKGNC